MANQNYSLEKSKRKQTHNGDEHMMEYEHRQSKDNTLFWGDISGLKSSDGSTIPIIVSYYKATASVAPEI